MFRSRWSPALFFVLFSNISATAFGAGNHAGHSSTGKTTQVKDEKFSDSTKSLTPLVRTDVVELKNGDVFKISATAVKQKMGIAGSDGLRTMVQFQAPSSRHRKAQR